MSLDLDKLSKGPNWELDALRLWVSLIFTALVAMLTWKLSRISQKESSEGLFWPGALEQFCLYMPPHSLAGADLGA